MAHPKTEPSLPKRDRRVHLVVGTAPDSWTFRRANDALNAFVADSRRGLALFHDHFTDRAGGLALFAVETASQRDAVRDPGPLADWELSVHPLIYADSAGRFLDQVDYTLKTYRKSSLEELDAVRGSEPAKADSQPSPCG